MASRPTDTDAARRLVILKYVVVHAMTAMPRPMIKGMLASASKEQAEKFQSDAEQRRDSLLHALRQHGLWDWVSPKESEFLASTAITMTQVQQVNASWRVESAQVLAWALRRIPELPPYDVGANPDFLKANAFPKNPSEVILSARLRPKEEIERQRSLAELWHWRSRTRYLVERGDKLPAPNERQAKGFRSYDDIVRMCAQKAAEAGDISQPIDEDFPVMAKAYRDLSADEWSKVTSITVERHFALNWLCGYAYQGHWDETPTDT